MADVDASIVIRTLNEAKWLPELLSAIDMQITPGMTVETVLVDSGSTDGTIEIARDHGCIIVTIDKADFTFGRSLNVGCDAARGRFLVFISGHCVPTTSSWLHDLCTPLAQSQFAYTYGRQVGRNGFTKFSEERLFAKYFPANADAQQGGFFCNNANAAVVRDAWQRFRFDENVTGLEDMALAKQLWQHGDAIGYVPEACVEHIHEETWKKVRIRYEREAIALQGIMPELHITFVDFVRYLTASIVMDMKDALKQRRLLSLFWEILRFRFSQYWGTYQGNNDHRKLSRQAKETYFYPS